MGTPFLNVTGRGLQYASIARAWGADVQDASATGLDTAIYRWGGTARTEFVSPGPVASLVLVRGLSSFATENFFDGKPDNPFHGALPAGQVALARPGARLRAVNAPGSVLHLYLPPAVLDAAAQAHGCRLGFMDCWQALQDPTLDRLLVAIEAELTSSSPPSALLDETLVSAVVAALARSLSLGRAPLPARGGLAPWQLRRVLGYLHDNLASDVRLGDLAALVNLSPHHFCRAFKASTGLPPHRMHIGMRLDRAQELLLHTALSIAEVAAAVGYDDPSHLARSFRKEKGLSPLEYRRERRS